MIYCNGKRENDFRELKIALHTPYFYRVKQVLQTWTTWRAQGRKGLAVLIDPDTAQVKPLLDCMAHAGADMVLVGGSLMVRDRVEECLEEIGSYTDLPLVLFPGSPLQISEKADALLYLSLISGRNPELLIGHHVASAPLLRGMDLEVISCGYMLVECGRSTTASYVSQTLPIPWNKPDIAAATALAGEYLGLKSLYLDGGSGADRPVSADMIRSVRASTAVPLIVGGGIRTESDLREAYEAGADLVVVGTAFEEAPELLFSFTEIKAEYS
jgi:phosphoglycerol geranylgeranyltransferase